jgi:uncharacterized protein YkwD
VDGRRFAALVAAGVVGAACVTAVTAAVRSDPVVAAAPGPGDSREIGWAAPEIAAPLAQDLFERVNAERAARGAPPLTWHAGLADTAERWSLQMIDEGSFEHSPEAFREHPSFLATGENILMGHRDSGEAHVAWMESTGHREAILHGDFDAIGIGVVCRNDGRMWATQVFGIAARRTSPRAAVDTAPDPVVRPEVGVSCEDVLADASPS